MRLPLFLWIFNCQRLYKSITYNGLPMRRHRRNASLQRRNHKRASLATALIKTAGQVSLALILIVFFVVERVSHPETVRELTMPPKIVPYNDCSEMVHFDVDRFLTLILGAEDTLYYFEGLIDPIPKLASYNPEDSHSIAKIIKSHQRGNGRLLFCPDLKRINFQEPCEDP